MKPVRVLHILWSLGTGGIEVWLRNVTRAVDRREMSFDFLVFEEGAANNLEGEMRERGCRVFSVSPYREPRLFGPKLAMVMAQHGPYDIAHCHFVPRNYPLVWARLAGVRSRFLHLHQASFGWPEPPRLEDWMLRRLGVSRAGQDANRVFAVSRSVARSWFPAEFQAGDACEILPCGIPLNGFDAPVDRALVRRSLGFTDGDWVVGHVGRLSEEKNHVFLVDVFARLARARPEARLLIVGDGPTAADVRARAASLGVSDRVRFAGMRADVATVLKGAVDYFLFPSKSEGLPMSVVEAQAAGLPMTVSDAVTPEVDVHPALIRRRSLADAPEEWARGVLSHATEPVADPATALAAVRGSPFALDRSVERLLESYRGAVSRQ